MFSLKNNKVERIKEVTFESLNMIETDVEEILRKNIEILCDNDEESLLIVGRQVVNSQGGRSDLTAVDQNGNIVLIEVKRDKKDIVGRKEAFEFQAIRYAAGYATIKDEDELVNSIYVPYIEKYRSEFENGDITPSEIANRKMKEFIEPQENWDFNKKQRIFLVASDYDMQTLSAVSWLSKNNVDISCFKIIPFIIKGELCLDVERVIPVVKYEDFYISIKDKEKNSLSKSGSKISRTILPKIDEMLEWGAVKAGDTIIPKGRTEEALLQSNGDIKFNGKTMSMQVWLKGLFGWSSIQTYNFAVEKESGKTLSDIRAEYMEQQQKENEKIIECKYEEISK